MDEKWQFVSISGQDFYQQASPPKTSESLFDPVDFQFQDPSPKTPDLFRTTEFDHPQPSFSFHSVPDSISPQSNGPECIPKVKNQRQITQSDPTSQFCTSPEPQTNYFSGSETISKPQQIQRTTSVPGVIERQAYAQNNFGISPPQYFGHRSQIPLQIPYNANPNIYQTDVNVQTGHLHHSPPPYRVIPRNQVHSSQQNEPERVERSRRTLHRSVDSAPERNRRYHKQSHEFQYFQQ